MSYDEEMEPMGRLVSCFVSAREGGEPLFYGRSDGVLVPNLDGYVILPKEVLSIEAAREMVRRFKSGRPVLET